ncbi:MAG: tetratricopeptide repeat protein, partial [Chitinophagales bacterium]
MAILDFSQKKELRQTAEKLLEDAVDTQEKQEFQKSIDLGEQAVVLFQQLGDEEKVIEIKLLNCQNYVTLGRMEKAFTTLKNLERDCNEKLGDFHELTIALLHQLTFFYIGILKKMEEGIAYANKCLKTHLNMKEKDASRMSPSYNNLGFAYGEIGDYDQQLLYYQKALSITLETVGEEHENIGRNYSNLGYYHQIVSEDYSKAIEYHQKALYINNKAFGEQSYLVALGYSNMGYTHLHIQDFDKAVEYYKKSLSILEGVTGRNHVYASIKLGLGNTYDQLGWHTQSIEEYAIALQICDKILTEKHPQRAAVLNSWSRALRKLGKYELALEKNHLALLEMLKVEKTNMDFFHTSYQIEDFKTIRPLLLVFVEKARICLASFYEKPNEHQYLQLCLQTCLLADRYIKKQRAGYHTSGTQMALNKNTMALYELGLQAGVRAAADQAKERQVAFDFSEQTKANLLLSSIHKSIVKQSINLPNALLQREKDLKLELTRLDKSIQLQESLGERKDKDYIQKLQNRFFDCHKVYLQLIKTFEQNHPDYYQLKYQTETTSIETIQSTLSDNQWMVSYFVGETHYYIFFIGKGVFEVLEYEKTDGFETLVNDFLQSIQQHQLEMYLKKAYELYQYLLQPVEMYLIDPLADFTSMEEHQEMAQMPQLIIIPHG